MLRSAYARDQSASPIDSQMLIAASILAWLVIGFGVATVFGLVAQLNQPPSPRARESAHAAQVTVLAPRGVGRRLHHGSRPDPFGSPRFH
jgi:hypothetical protein